MGTWTTDNSGVIHITGLYPGYYLVREVIPPTNFALGINNIGHVFLRADGTSVVPLTFANDPYGSLLITLRNSVTGDPIQNGEFRVTTSAGTVLGTNNGHFWTNLQCEILIPNVRPDSYVITKFGGREYKEEHQESVTSTEEEKHSKD